MELKGYQMGSLEDADMLLVYHVGLTDEWETTTMVGFEDRISEWSHNPEDFRNLVIEFEHGSLLLDVISAKSGKVFWRGVVSAIIDPDDSQHVRRN